MLCRFRSVLEGKTGKEIPELLRLEFLANSLANNFALLDAEGNTSRPVNRRGKADLPLLKSTIGNLPNLESFVLWAYASFTGSRTIFFGGAASPLFDSAVYCKLPFQL